jgi:hypothetical protein
MTLRCDSYSRSWNKAFQQQMEWELSALEKADVILHVYMRCRMTMLELGLWASSGRVVVWCDKRV